MGLNFSQLLFLVFSAFALSSALAVIFTRHTVYAAFFFIAHLLGLSVIYGLLNAPLIAVLQVMVYAGAVMVLFLFAIMILDASVLERIDFRRELAHVGLGVFLTAVLAGLLFYFGKTYVLKLALALPLPPPSGTDVLNAGYGNVAEIGKLLYKQYLFPFELISVLLVVAVIGIMVMAKKKLEN